MTGPLLNARFKRLRNRLSSVDLLSAIRGGALAVLGAAVLVGGLQSLWIERALALTDPAARRAEILASAMRLATLLAAVMSFSTFGDLWRSAEGEILGRLPVPPRSMYTYRLVSSAVDGAPYLLVAILALAPVWLAGHGGLFFNGLATIGLVYTLAVLWGLYWHLEAGLAVADPAAAALKQMSAGGVTTPERAMLLYSPMFAMATAFGVGLVFFLGLDGLHDGTALGPLGVLGGVIGVVMGFKKGREAFEAGYYRASAALADGEALDAAFVEAAPGPEYFGRGVARSLPAGIRPFVERDLRQAWRRNRLTPWMIFGAGVLLALLAGRLGSWLLPGVALVGIAAGGEAFRLARPGSDTPWLWLTLPARLGQQVMGRVVAAGVYPTLAAPGITLALWRGGAGVGGATAGVAALYGLSAAAVCLSLLSVAHRGPFVGVYVIVGAGVAMASGGDPLRAAGLAWGAAALGAVALTRLKERLVSLETAR